MPKLVENDVSAIIPEIWSSMVQEPLYKSLVSFEVANTRLEGQLSYGDTIHMPYFDSLSAQTYTPGTEISATNLDWHYDDLTVTTKKHTTFYVDDVEALQANVEQIRPLAEEAAYQLRDAIDSSVFANITGANGGTQVNDQDLRSGGTDNRPVTASSGQVIELFSQARKVLREANVEEVGDMAAVISPLVAQRIEQISTEKGYNVADSTLRNGYIGDFMGFQLFVSNNLPTGACSTIAPNEVCGNAVSATDCKGMYFGRKGAIDLVMQKSPSLEIKEVSDMIGANFITWTVYGSAVFSKNQNRFLNVPLDITCSTNS